MAYMGDPGGLYSSRTFSGIPERWIDGWTDGGQTGRQLYKGINSRLLSLCSSTSAIQKRCSTLKEYSLKVLQAGFPALPVNI